MRRFRQALARLLPEEARVGLAVSGGPDSLAMLLLANAGVPGQFEVATVDHGLRAEAAQECALVGQHCQALGVRCTTIEVEVGEGNLQERARTARYAALARWAEERGLAAIATAHHADDQAETLLRRLNRGSGVAGLAGIRERAVLAATDPPLLVIRPLLGFRRSELAEVVAAAGIEASCDPSNANDRFDRVRIRKALAATDWLDPVAAARSASHLAEAEDALAQYAGLLWSRHVELAGGAATFQPAVPRIMRLRIVERILAELGGEARGGEIARLVDGLESGRGGNLGGILATVDGDRWVFRREPPRRTA